MPRFVCETTPTDDAARAVALRLAARRFPEVSLEQRLDTREGDRTREVWVCRAPSRTHIQRWAVACGLVFATVKPVQ